MRIVMATKTKRWAVRADYDGSPYMLFLGNKPRKRSGGWSQEQPGYFTNVGQTMFEKFFPEDCYLKRDGGPVEIRFADEK